MGNGVAPVHIGGVQLALSVNTVMHKDKPFGTVGDSVIHFVFSAGWSWNVDTDLRIRLTACIVGHGGQVFLEKREASAVNGDECVVGGHQNVGQTQLSEEPVRPDLYSHLSP